MSLNTITLNSLYNNYLSYLQAQNSNININNINTFWTIDAGAMSSILLDLYMNLQTTQNSIYPQYAVGDQVDQWLYAQGLPARGTSTYTSVIVDMTMPSSYPYTIPINTVLTDSATGNQFQTLQEWTIPDSKTRTITLWSLVVGSSISEPIGANLVDSSSTYQGIVQSCQVGQNSESDISCITRLLQAIRTPQAGSRVTDYYNFALESDSNVTDCITIPSFIDQNNVGILGVFPLVGSSITEYQLDQGLISGSFVQYSRTSGSDVLDTVNIYIQNQRLVGQPVYVYPNNTYVLPTIDVFVSLVSGYSLASTLIVKSQNSSGQPVSNTYTINQLIQKELRRAICTQPYGATPQGNGTPPNLYITLDSLITQVTNQLGATNGVLAQVITNLIIAGGDIQVPAQNNSTTSIQYTYDVNTYTGIVVNLL